jgi:hypothetical protein
MSKSAIRLLTLATMASVMVVAPAKADSAKKHRHVQRSVVLGYPGPSLVTMPSGPNCPGLARSIDCKTWPPYGEDPDRKASGSDGG